MASFGLDTVATRLKEGYYDVPYRKKDIWKEGHVVDENLSVKENRRLVEEHNKEEEQKALEYTHMRGVKSAEKRKDFIEGIKGYSNQKLNDEQAKKILDFAYENFDDDNVDNYITSLYDVIDLVDSVMSSRDKAS